MEGDQDYNVSSIVVPVFNADERVEFVLSLIGHDNPISGERIATLAQDMKDASSRIGASVLDARKRRLLPPR